MKKVFTVLLLLAVTLVLTIPAAAVAPQWTYECAQATVTPTIDGTVSAGEWDDANELVVNNDAPIFQQFGFWQNNANAPAIPSSDLSVTYKVKWDATNLYILEVRTDKFYQIFPDSTVEPWNHSGTLFFLSYDSANYDEPSGDGTYEIFWVTQWSDGKPALSGRYGSGKTLFYAGDPEMAGWVTAGSVSGDVYTFEAAIPWATMNSATDGVFPATATVGEKMRFTPIVSAFTEPNGTQFGDDWNQLDFYVNTDSPDDVTGEGGMELVAALPVATTAAPDTTAAPAATDAPAIAPAPAPNPTTGDNNALFVFIGIAVLAAGTLLVVRRVSSK